MAARWVKQEFTYTGGAQTWRCPAGVKVVFLRGVGAGGGGGKGNAGTAANSSVIGGGGSGGGGAVETLIAVDVVPGVLYDITIPAGGAGGTSGENAVAGGDTIIKAPGTAAGEDIARFNGANQGRLGLAGNVQAGEPVRMTALFSNWYNPLPGLGGFGGYSGDGRTHGCSGFSNKGGALPAQGTGGLHGTSAGVKFAGGGGGGGGRGVGPDVSTDGVGGAGGNGNGAGAGFAGSVGTANTQPGGGGGGGGGGGCGTSGGAGGNGGQGGPGRLVIEWVE